MRHAELAGLLHAWVRARSVARGLPAPVPDQGGDRVDTNGVAEIARWVFAGICPGLVELGRTIDAPGYVLKACVSGPELRAVLPGRWRLQAPSYFMTAEKPPVDRPSPAGYRAELDRHDARTHVRITTNAGELAANGYGGETGDAFVFDRIETTVAHRRKGLGRAVMAVLDDARRNRSTPALLVATEDGHALYSMLGWRVISPYATAAIA